MSARGPTPGGCPSPWWGESRRRGATDVNIKRVARNASAIQAFHDLGFRTLGHVQLFMSLDRAGSYWRTGPELHGRAFDC